MEYRSIPEVAERWGISRVTVRRMIRRGDLPAIRIGTGAGVLRVPASAVEEYEAQRLAGDAQ